MKITLELAIALVLASTLVPPFATAQQASPMDTDLSIQRMERRRVVVPKPTPEQIQAEADAAVRSYEIGATTPNLVGQPTLRQPSRPDLNDDVTGGIQTQRINDALRGR